MAAINDLVARIEDKELRARTASRLGGSFTEMTIAKISAQ